MGFIADALYESRRGRMRFEREWQVRAEHKESLLPQAGVRRPLAIPIIVTSSKPSGASTACTSLIWPRPPSDEQ